MVFPGSNSRGFTRHRKVRLSFFEFRRLTPSGDFLLFREMRSPMRFFVALCLSLLFAVAAFAQSTPATEPAAGFSIDNLDKTADPCTDFYQYACGTWLNRTTIPADQSEWVSFVELYERNLVTERGILEQAASSTAKRSAIEQKI